MCAQPVVLEWLKLKDIANKGDILKKSALVRLRPNNTNKRDPMSIGINNIMLLTISDTSSLHCNVSQS